MKLPMKPKHSQDTDPTVRIPKVLERLNQAAISHKLILAESNEAASIADWIEANFPISGVQIDWDKVPGHSCLRWHDEDRIIDSIAALTLHLAADSAVIVTWSDALRPSIEMRLRDVMITGKGFTQK